MATNYTLDRDLKEAEAMAEGLAEYVRGTALYGSTGGGVFGGGAIGRPHSAASRHRLDLYPHSAQPRS